MYLQTNFLTDKFKDIYEIENFLRIKIKDKELLGQIHLSEEDYNFVIDLVRNELNNSRSKFKYLKNKIPLTISIILVHVGIKKYQEGNFWDPIYKKLNLDGHSSSWNEEFGELFYLTLNTNNLIEFDPGRNKYVNQILAHGIVPEYYYEEYFENLLYKEFGHLLNLAFTKKDIVKVLKNIREDYNGYIDRNNKKSKILNKSKFIYNKIKEYKLTLDNYNNLSQLDELKKQRNKNREINKLLKLPDDYLDKKEAEVNEIENKINIKKLLNKKEILNNRSSRIYQELIKGNYDEVNVYKINEDYLMQLKSLLVERKESITSKKKFKFLQKLSDLFTHVIDSYLPIKTNIQRIDNKLKRLFEKVSLKDIYYISPSLDIYEHLNQLQSLLKEKESLNNKIKAFQDGKDYSKKYEDTSLNELEEIKKNINSKIIKYKMKLNIISDDEGIKEGLNILEKERHRENKINELIENINIEDDFIPNLLKIVNEYSLNELERYIKKDQAKFKTLNKEYKILKKELEVYPNKLYYFNESLVIFLIQAGPIAEEFIYLSLKVLQKIKNNNFSNNDNQLLYPQICTAMKHWWTKFTEERSIKYLNRDNYRIFNENPYLKLFFEDLELNIVVPRQILVKPDEKFNRPKLKILTNDNKEMHCYNLDVFIKEDDLIEIEDITIAFPEELNFIKLELLLADELVIEQDFKRTPWYFLSNNGKVSNLNPFELDQVTLVLKDNYRLSTEEIIIQKDSLAGSWTNYSYYNLNLDDIKILSIYDNKDNVVKHFKRYQELNPTLDGGKLSNYFLKLDNKIYENILPQLVFSLNNYDKLRLWDLRVHHLQSGQFKQINLEEIKDNIKLEDGLARIYLDEIIHVYGDYKLEIKDRSSRSRDWGFKFIYIPEIKIHFDKPLYEIKKEKSVIAKMNYSLQQNHYNLVLKEEDLLIEHNKKNNYMSFYPDKHEFPVKIISRENFGDFDIDLNLSLPIIVYSIKSDDFTIENAIHHQEIWIDDILRSNSAELLLKLPKWMKTKNIKLKLNENEQVLKYSYNHQIISFNILNLSDNIRTSSQPVQKIYLEIILEGELYKFNLFDVRSKWEIINFKLNSKYSDENCELDLSWTEKGRATNKNLTIWNYNKQELIKSIEIDEKNNLSLEIPKDILVPGNYLFEFKEQSNIWSKKDNTNTSKTDNNCFLRIVGTRADFINELKNSGIRLVFVQNESGNKDEINYLLIISDIKDSRDLEFPGEKRFEGKLIFIKNSNGNYKDFEYNPVSFYFEDNSMSLPFLVDKDKDGITYCSKCRNIFWDDNGKQHSESLHRINNIRFVPYRYYVEFVKNNK